MLDCQKNHFSIPEEITYLNGAFMGPMLKSVEEVGHLELRKRLQPFNYKRDDFFAPVEKLKKHFAKLINCDQADRIVLIPAASYGIANAANNIDFSKKKSILVVGEQFPSNIYSWQKLVDQKGAKIKIISAPESQANRTADWNNNILNAIDEDTAVIAMGHVHWADGTLFDLKAIRKKATDNGALLIIDGTQSIGALPFDIKEIQPDALICGSYKWMLGPYGLGLAYYGPAFDQGTPIEDNWINRKNSEQFENLVNYQAAYKPMASRYSVGEQSNFVYVPMLDTSIQQLLEWQPARIQAYCKNLVLKYLPEFKDLGCTLPADSEMAFHIFGIRMPQQLDILKLKEQFDQENIFISIRGNAVRVSPNVYNQEQDMKRLLESMKASMQIHGV